MARFLELLDRGEGARVRGGRRGGRRRRPRAHGPRRRRTRVRHGRRGRRARGELPQPVAARADVRPRRARAGDRRRPSATAFAWRTNGACSAWRSRARGGACCSPRARPEAASRASARRRGSSPSSAPNGCRFPQAPAGEPLSVEEAAAAWRRDLARPDERAAVRLAALEGLVALGVDPSAWWFQRDWTDTGRAAARARPRVLLAAGEAGELRAPVRPGRGARAGEPRRLPRVGGQPGAHADRGVRGRTDRANRGGAGGGRQRAVAPAGVPVDRGLRGVPPRRHRADAPGVGEGVRRGAVAREGAPVRVRGRRRHRHRLHRPRRRPADRRLHHHRLQDRQEGEHGPARRTTCSSASTTWR